MRVATLRSNLAMTLLQTHSGGIVVVARLRFAGAGDGCRAGAGARCDGTARSRRCPADPRGREGGSRHEFGTSLHQNWSCWRGTLCCSLLWRLGCRRCPRSPSRCMVGDREAGAVGPRSRRLGSHSPAYAHSPRNLLGRRLAGPSWQASMRRWPSALVAGGIVSADVE